MKVKHLVALSSVLFITFGCQICLAELSANAALTSNYVWRGETLSDDSFALQGGANWSNESGIYAEIWGSTTDDGTDTDIEYDLYAGYNIEMDAATIDIGLVRYDLIDADDADVIEFYLGGSIGPVNAYYSIDNENDTTYITAAYEVEVQEYSINAYIGSWGDTLDGNHFGATLGREYSGFDISLSLDVSDEKLADDTLFFLMVSKSWDL